MSTSPLLLLALDTSTSTASVAVYDGERVLSETNWQAGREHSSRLLVEAHSALERVGRTPSHLTGLVVARGPGSFTGVRVGLSVAKGIAAALHVPAWGVSTLDVVAQAATGSSLPVCALVEAGRGRYATALYRAGACVEAPRLATLAGVVSAVAEPTLFIGEIDAAARAQLSAHAQVSLASPAACLRRGGFVAELGWRQAANGEAGDARQLDALYVS